MPGTRFFTEKDAAACIVLCFTMARMVQRRESRKLCRMIAGCWTGRDRSLAGWRRCGTGLQAGKGKGIVAHMALFFSNVRPDSCREVSLAFSRAAPGKSVWLAREQPQACDGKRKPAPERVREWGGSGAGVYARPGGEGSVQCARACSAGKQREAAEGESSGSPGSPDCQDCPGRKDSRQDSLGEDRHERLTGEKTWADCWICRSGLREGLSEKNSLEERAGRIAWEGAWREEGRQEGVRREDDGGKSL